MVHVVIRPDGYVEQIIKVNPAKLWWHRDYMLDLRRQVGVIEDVCMHYVILSPAEPKFMSCR